jgi:hypothetical protein
MDNREYVRGLLSERMPGFFAALQLAERQVDSELSRERKLDRPGAR